VRSRAVIDYALQRRARLTDVARGRISLDEVCDAHPYLRLAARHYGEPAAQSCPVCDKSGAEPGALRLRRRAGPHGRSGEDAAEIARMAATTPEFDVYVVEVCPDCGWNHLMRSYVLGAVSA